MIPRTPIHIKANGLIVDYALNQLASENLPAYDLVITSGYRTPAYNATLPGAAEDSAHIYNLARDFTLRNRASGQIVSDAQLKAVYEQYVKPNWPGYSYFSPKEPHTNTGWIHVNLDRKISKSTAIAAYGIAAVGAGFFFKKYLLPKILKYMKERKA